MPLCVPVPVPVCLWLPQLRYARCTILWMGEWTRNSMRAVPGMIVPNIMREDENANQTIDQLISIHESCKPRGATPRDYVQVRRVVACACVHVCSLYGCMAVPVYVPVCLCLCMCLYACACVCACMPVPVCVHVCLCSCVCMCACMPVCPVRLCGL